MFTRSPRELKLTIDEDGPGTILHDFGAFLTFIKEREMSVTPMHQLRRRMLPEINERLARPIQMGLKRPLQKSYPHINGLYLLVRASGLTCVEGTASKPVLVVDDVVYRAWQGLNHTERYCTLLEAWLLRGHPEIIGERGYGWFRTPDTFKELPGLFQRIPDAGLPVAGHEEVEDSIRYFPGLHNLALLELFGLIVIHAGPPEPGKGWIIERIERTPLGDALVGVLQPTLQPYFPEWQNNLYMPEWAFREGAHVFKVTLWEGLWWRIAIPADRTLDELASTILDSVEFYHDHLYTFEYQNRFGVTERINHSYMDEGPFTSDVLVGDTPLRIGQAMTFIYDFGDWWRFEVALERVDPDMALKKPVVLEAEGTPPDQYGWH